MSKFSIIIPAYNVEKYISECLDSLVNQDYNDFEIIFVDDGSTDKTRTICNEYCKKYNNIKVFCTEHVGVSAARNIGINNSNGEYILFLDSDDYIDIDSLNYIFHVIEKTKKETYISNFKTIREDDARDLYDREIDYTRINNKKMNEVLNYIKQSKIIFTVWRFIVKRDIILKNKLFFIEGIVHEDEEWVIKLLCSIKNLYYIDKPYYNYRLRKNSITGSVNLFNVYCYYDVVRRLMEYAIREKTKYKKDFYLFYVKKISKYTTKLLSSIYDIKKEMKIRKNIIIYGCSRSGKSTLARKISHKFNYNMISLDSIITAFQFGMPELNINHNRRNSQLLDEVSGFITSYIRSLNHITKRTIDINYVIEGCYLDMDRFLAQFNKDKFIIIILGYDGTPQQLYNDIRTNDTENDWTNSLSNSELLDYCELVINNSKQIKKYCKKNNLDYYDMSGDRTEKIFKIIDEIRIKNEL